MNGKSGFAIWLTGLPASGKSTLAHLLAQEIKKLGLRVQVLDSDELRRVLTPQPTYEADERKWFYQVLSYIGKLLAQNGINVIIAATAHQRTYRWRASQVFNRFLEIYTKCPVEICMQRDQKGLYKKAMSGEIGNLPGVQQLYEEPQATAIIVDTAENSPVVCVQKILTHLEKFNYIPKREASK
jgi:adenylylsulfate kinase